MCINNLQIYGILYVTMIKLIRIVTYTEILRKPMVREKRRVIINIRDKYAQNAVLILYTAAIIIIAM